MAKITSKIELVTPSKARKWLEKHNTHNRNIRLKGVRNLAAAILRNEWQITHQGIAFAVDGTLLDGQHRLSAIILADKAVYIIVVRNLSKTIFSAIDINIPRRAMDTYSMFKDTLEGVNVAKATAIARNMYEGPNKGNASELSTYALATFTLEHQETIALVLAYLSKSPNYNSAVAAAFCNAIRRHNINKVGPLMEQIRDNTFPSKGYPLNKLAEYMRKNSRAQLALSRYRTAPAPFMRYRYALSAIRAVLDGKRDIKSLQPSIVDFVRRDKSKLNEVVISK